MSNEFSTKTFHIIKNYLLCMKIEKIRVYFFSLLQYCNTRLFNEPGTVMYLFYSIIKYINGGKLDDGKSS